MTTSELKTMKITKLRKTLKNIITWDSGLIKRSSREIIINAIKRYEKKDSPKYGLFMQNLKNN
tara:strand:- start:339 stop:527 length:189 start_codon:yes stop_codon:yes gene_type:complete